MFQSLSYWLLLTMSVLLYWTLPRSYRKTFLIVISCGYIYYLDRQGFIGLSVWVFVYLAIGWSLRKKISEDTSWLIVSAVFGLVTYLAWYKYMPVVMPSSDQYVLSVAPLGISFITFRLIHYIVEVQHGNLKPYGPLDFLAYAFFFPIWTAGPIHRFDNFSGEDSNLNNYFDKEDIRIGINRIINGLIKKFVFADQLLPKFYGNHASSRELLDGLSGASTQDVWWFLIVSFLILYMDFSGYSDMAIGSGRLFGISILENFNFPIVAKNVSEYWKRWHMTLAHWCQNYVYMPILARTRQPYIAVLVTFSVMGIWHAGSLHWLFWGLHHALGITLHRLWTTEKRKRKWNVFSLGITRYFAIPLTLMWVVAAGAFTTVHNVGTIADSFTILGRAFIPSLPSTAVNFPKLNGD
jgi:alginate O-acetyltransferase complex protein AlgI